MESIYNIVNTLAGIWIFTILIIFAFSGSTSARYDRFSVFFMIITLSISFAVMRYTINAGEAAAGAFSWGFPILSYLGFFLIFLGALIHLTGIITLNKQLSAVVMISKNQKLVDTGIYKYIRHPIYAGLLLEFLGFGIALANWLTILVMLIPNVVSLIYRIYVEEKALKDYFGVNYVNYARKTKRIIPGIF